MLCDDPLQANLMVEQKYAKGCWDECSSAGSEDTSSMNLAKHISLYWPQFPHSQSEKMELDEYQGHPQP